MVGSEFNDLVGEHGATLIANSFVVVCTPVCVNVVHQAFLRNSRPVGFQCFDTVGLTSERASGQ